MSDRIGEPLSRIDGQAKVTGRATYAAEFELPDLAHASLVLSTIPHGRVSALDSVEAERQAGVYAVLTHQNAPRLPYRQFTNRPVVDPKAGDQLKVFQGPEVLFSGQPIAAVIADSLEHARQAAALVHVEYEAAVAATHFDMDRAHPPSPATARAGRPGEAARGNADRALADSPFTVDAVYIQAREHHNAMEPHATIAYWQDGKLTLYDKTQWVDNDRAEIAHVFGISEDDIRVISPYVGGAFGSALRTWPHVTIAALAARQTGRPVRLELSRRELYTAIGFRPHTLQRVALGAKRNGELKALIQEATAQTSQYEEYAELTLEPAQITYSCPNVRSRFRLVEMHTNTPCPMRAPGIATGTLGLEIAMDELAVALDMDPLDLRLRNYAERDEDKNLPWSRKELRACYHAAAERFGWNH
ncbi:MAG TPA: molybdopterin cofactor-binding domain-containing protein, partial [Terriglobales bacterium]|nr:molybdopterin cofactor-binding domain-containing protein [Terriglobales bacterium]